MNMAVNSGADTGRPVSPSRVAGAAFWLYKRCVSPVLHAVAPGGCRYLPTCSEYAYTALARFGIITGGWLTIRRLLRCHPWAHGGLDPVPQRRSPVSS
jgi:putative membrane protein insertion efficiency factor